LNAADTAVFEDMGAQGRSFFESVAELPNIDGVQLQRESRRFEECLARAKAQLKRASAASSSKAHTPQSLQL